MNRKQRRAAMSGKEPVWAVKECADRRSGLVVYDGSRYLRFMDWASCLDAAKQAGIRQVVTESDFGKVPLFSETAESAN